jgi:UDP-N-acetylglucosamine 4,6-dehydratase
MKVVDVAAAMAPSIPRTVIGIRPGEKLHEIMITGDDARATLELDDRYVIEPTFAFWEPASYKKRGAKPVRETFVYASDRNDDWLDAPRLMELLEAK